MKRRLRAPSPALVISLVALFVALGGTTYAATSLPKNSVGTKQLKSGAVTKKKINKKTIATLRGARGLHGATGATGPPGTAGAPGAPGPTASAYAQNQNTFAFVDSATDTTAVQLTAGGGTMLNVPFPADLHLSGVVRLRNNTGSGNMDQSGCRPQIAPAGGSFSDVGPEMLGLTNGFNAFNDEATIAVVGELNVAAGSYDARIVCHRTFSSGSTEQNKFNGDAISVIAVAH
jgi:hypothetical protein